MKLELRERFETAESEHLKTLMEFGLHTLASHKLGEWAIELASGGTRIEDQRLQTELAGLELENPLLVGAGWDKKGRAVDGLYFLGFAGVEVGSVLVHPQAGNPRPRLWTDRETNSVGLNRLGFNSQGMEVVARNLEQQRRLGVTGISLGRNKLTPEVDAPWAHAAVAEHLFDVADYFVINVSSPNTPGLRNALKREPLTDIVQAVQEVVNRLGRKPIFIKTTVDLSLGDLDEVLQVCVDEDMDGVIDSNTTIEEYIKRKYGWEGQMGGVSGNDPDYRQKATERMRHITKETEGTGLARIGVGAINDTDSAMERIQAGAQALQIVTAIREHKGRVARNINAGLLERIERDGVRNISEYVGIAA